MSSAIHRSARPLFVVSGAVAVALVGVTAWWLFARGDAKHAHSTADVESHASEASGDEPGASADPIIFSAESWKAASIQIAPASRAPLSQVVELTGKIALNEDRVAHIYPMVEGRVDEVKVNFGAQVKKGDLLVVIQSREIGQALLQLYQNRLALDFAIQKDAWTQTTAKNTLDLIKLIREEAPIERIESQLRDRPLGEFRDKLMTPYIDRYKSMQDLARLQPLQEGGAIPGKQILEAQANSSAAKASLQSFVEQVQQDVTQASITSAQAVKELKTRVAVDETNLKILGMTDESLANIDPKQGESLSHYSIFAPFDGTIISKDVVLLERVGPESQLLSIADLSTVWVKVDIYEEHLPLIKQAQNQTVQLTSNSWPGKTFEAEVFYTGDVVDETSRTLALRAIAQNDEGMLKPGMFVNVRLPAADQATVLQVPVSAIMDHESKSFVFVHQGGDAFERRDVSLGRSNGQTVEIVSGLKEGEAVVTSGGFALKSQMLAELLSE
jgi:cobalt-zinc-cadmium efflux system membrane fusion protein